MSNILLEGLYGTSRSSYLKMESARMIVRHSAKINEDTFGSRGRNIQSIYVENANGERMLFPTTQLAPARAFTNHINNGGNFNDTISEAILEMAHDYANLGLCSRYIYSNQGSLNESAFDLRENVRTKIAEMRKVFEKMCRKRGYMEEAQRIEEASTTLTESGDTPDYINEIENLRGLLTIEGIELADTVLESVAKHLSESLVEKKEAPETISVLGKPLTLAAWTAFKNGELHLSRPVETEHTPLFKSKTAELTFKLGEIAPNVADDSLSNFLGYIAETLPIEKNPEIVRKMRIIGMQALKLAGMNLDESANSPIIKEFGEWINSFSPNKILTNESEDNPLYNNEDQINTKVDAAIENFNVDDFLETQGSDFNLDDMTNNPEFLETEDKSYDKDYIIKSLISYLDHQVNDYEDTDVVDETVLEDAAEQLFPQVKEAMEAKGYIINDDGLEVEDSLEEENLNEYGERDNIRAQLDNANYERDRIMSKFVKDKFDTQELDRLTREIDNLSNQFNSTDDENLSGLKPGDEVTVNNPGELPTWSRDNAGSMLNVTGHVIAVNGEFVDVVLDNGTRKTFNIADITPMVTEETCSECGQEMCECDTMMETEFGFDDEIEEDLMSVNPGNEVPGQMTAHEIDDEDMYLDGDNTMEPWDSEPRTQREELLLPTDQGHSLEGEVRKSTTTDPQTGEEIPADDSYVSRLRQLAGMGQTPYNKTTRYGY